MNQKLIDLAVWLRANPVPKLDMTCWTFTDRDGCGTTHCIMGWVADNKQFGFYLTGNSMVRHSGCDPEWGSWDAICHGLDIYQQAAEHLFLAKYTEGMSFNEIVDQIENTGKSW